MTAPARGGSTIDVALAVWNRRGRLATGLFGALLAGSVTIALSLPGMHRSTATLLVAHPGAPEGFARMGVTGDLETRLNTITEDILSRARLAALMDQFNLYPELRGKRDVAVERIRGDIATKLKRADPGPARQEPGPTMLAFSVSFRGRDRETVSRVANALASLYVHENLKLRVQARVARLRQELAQMQQIYSDEYPDVVRLRMEIAGTERQLAGGALTVGDGLLPGERAAFARGALREEKPTEIWDRIEFRIVDPAIPDWKTAAPNRIRLVVFGIMFALGATAAAVLLAERLDTSFHTSDELGAFTTIPVLAAIPSIVTAVGPSRQRRLTTATIAAGLALGVLVSYYFARGNEQLVWMLTRGAF
jgi:hypothetical protein